MKYATLNEYHPNYDIPEGYLFRILPKRRMEGDTKQLRCVVAKQQREGVDLCS